MKTKSLAFFFAVSLAGASARAQNSLDGLRAQLPAKVGEQLITQAVPLNGELFVKNDNDSGFLMHYAANEKRLLQITKDGVVNEIFEFRGMPFLWTKKGDLFAVDPFFGNEIRSKRTFMILRTFNPTVIARALGTGVGLWLVAYIGTSVSSQYFEMDPLTGWHGLITGVLAYYGYDHGRTIFVDTPFSLGLKTNLFTTRLARRVVEVRKAYDRDDYEIIVERKKGGERHSLYLSDLMPEYTKTSSCAERLSRLIMRRH